MEWFSPPATHKCLGLSLAPLSLGHVFLLRQYNSPFLSYPEPSQLDVVLAAFICADRYNRTLKHLKSPFRNVLFWIQGKRKWNWLHEAGAFKLYLKQNLSIPPVRLAKGYGERDASTPWEFYLLAKSLSYGLSYDEAMTLPLITVNRIHIASLINAGRVKEWTSQAEDLWQYAKEQDALRAMEGN